MYKYNAKRKTVALLGLPLNNESNNIEFLCDEHV